MLEISESPQTEGLRTVTNLGTSTTACKKVQCSSGVLDSAEFWLRNDKALCQIDFLEDRSEGGCVEICFVNLEQRDATQKDDEWTKALASISPSLPEFILSENIPHLQESEIMLLNSLQSPKIHPSDSASHQIRRAASVCLFRCAGGRQPDGVARETNRFLTGLASARERQSCGSPPGRRAEEDAELSASSVDEDFLTASEHLRHSNEEGPLQTDFGSGNFTDPLQSGTGPLEASVSQQPCQRTPRDGYRCVEILGAVPCAVTPDLLVPSLSQACLPREEPEVAPCSQSHSFKLPKIIIMQSTDSDDGAGDQPGSPSSKVFLRVIPGEESVPRFSSPCSDLAPLVCAATITSTYPWLRGPISPQLKTRGERDERQDFSLFSALCGVAQVAGAVALADLAKANDDASAEVFRANIARVLLGEASAILCQRGERRSVADLLQSGSGEAKDTITGPNIPCSGHRKVDRFTRAVADSIWEQATKRAAVKKELESPSGDVPRVQDALLESVNTILFDVLCVTAKKISDISICDVNTFVRQESEIHPGDQVAKSSGEPLNQLLQLSASRLTDTWGQNSMSHCTDARADSSVKKKEENTQEEEEEEEEDDAEMPSSHYLQKGKDHLGSSQVKGTYSPVRGCSDPSGEAGRRNTVDVKIDSEREKKPPCSDPKSCPLVRERILQVSENKSSLLTPQLTPSSPPVVTRSTVHEEFASPVSGFADDLAATVVSMATELAAIYLENSSGKQPWFCSLKGVASKTPQRLLLPCRRRKEAQSDGGCVSAGAKKHRPPRLSEIKRKAEEQPELMERLVNRVVDETVIPDESPDAALQSEVTAKAVTCPELSVVDTSAEDQAHSRLGCEHFSRGKVASRGSIPEEEDSPSITLGPAARLGQDLSRGGSISKQSSCESITDEFSKFMVNQMENEGRGFDLLLDYYAGKSAGSILSAAMQQVAGRRSNGHLNVRSACVSKQSSTESITEEFYRFMLRDLDRESREDGMFRANTLLPPSPRSHFCIRQSSMPDRRSSDSRLTVNAPVKANSFDDFGRSGHRNTLGVYPAGSSSTAGLCRSDSCLYQRSQMDRITDALILETWRGSIESLMRKNKIIVDEPEDAEGPGDRRPHVELFANRLVADIMESGKSSLGSRRPVSVGERRRCFRTKAEIEWSGRGQDGNCTFSLGSRDVPQIHIQEDQKVQLEEDGLRHSPEETPESPLQLSSETWGLCDSAEDSLENGAVGSSGQTELLVMNFDLGRECVDWNLRATMQWIAASELGVPAIYFRKSPGSTDKFQDVVQLVAQRGWTVGNLFCAVMQFCEIQEGRADFLDWLLERLRP
ncbi:hypothetical protein SKAU_G00114570 [Synaphobranchus kaupii]|uniref:A-kinase anchor protein SPHKAP n=1 Tax=Synaphobranchus kaupii TaxID=118154 RepID=A0A9Q1FMS8_SYNKA|nr:hypothetical protein SKAU_G00114570 [Synaphobranchus kaupii]